MKSGLVVGPLQSENKDSEYASVTLFSVVLNSSYLFGLVLKQEKNLLLVSWQKLEGACLV